MTSHDKSLFLAQVTKCGTLGPSPPGGDTGILADYILCHYHTKHITSMVTLEGKEKSIGYCVWSFVARPTRGVYHCHPHPIAQNLINWPYVTHCNKGLEIQ